MWWPWPTLEQSIVSGPGVPTITARHWSTPGLVVQPCAEASAGTASTASAPAMTRLRSAATLRMALRIGGAHAARDTPAENGGLASRDARGGEACEGWRSGRAARE